MKNFLLTGASTLMLCVPVAAHADEGMWLPSQTGAIADAMKVAGLELDPATLGDLNTDCIPGRLFGCVPVAAGSGRHQPSLRGRIAAI